MDRLEREVRATSLALRYREGELGVLGELHAALLPWIRGFLRSRIGRRDGLPVGLDVEDLYQQSYVLLAEAALEWEAERHDSFAPYFLSSFPWRIERYLRLQTPLRRTTHFRLFSLPHDELMAETADAVGLDGRSWDEVLGCAELMEGLPGLERRVVELYLHHGLSFAEIGGALGISRSAAHRAFDRAIMRLRSLAEGAAASGRGRHRRSRRGPGSCPDSLRRCVEALHRLAPDGGPLPGGPAVRRAAGLTQREYRQIMAKLCALGCVVGRGQGRAGRLTCAKISETLAMLGDGGRARRRWEGLGGQTGGQDKRLESSRREARVE